jgi:hypothetical protein
LSGPRNLVHLFRQSQKEAAVALAAALAVRVALVA